MFLVWLVYFVLIVFVLIGVAFFTLFERSVLGYVHNRVGPGSVGVLGFLQPFSDAISLFFSELFVPLFSLNFVYYMCPVIMIFLSLFMWVVFPFLENFLDMSLGMLLFLCCIGFGVYAIMVAGWSSGSSYSLLGGVRGVAQTISYEVSLALVLMCFVLFVGGYDFVLFGEFQEYMWLVFCFIPLVMIWFGSVLAELNRTPFDLSEGESELVSGFNVEYGGGGFALIFMAEYSSILFMGMVIVNMFFYGSFFFISLVSVSFLIVWVRGTLPRVRYDFLMALAWSSFLPVSLGYLVLLCGVVLFFFV